MSCVDTANPFRTYKNGGLGWFENAQYTFATCTHFLLSIALVTLGIHLQFSSTVSIILPTVTWPNANLWTPLSQLRTGWRVITDFIVQITGVNLLEKQTESHKKHYAERRFCLQPCNTSYKRLVMQHLPKQASATLTHHWSKAWRGRGMHSTPATTKTSHEYVLC